jgi:hypothetical protein
MSTVEARSLLIAALSIDLVSFCMPWFPRQILQPSELVFFKALRGSGSLSCSCNEQQTWMSSTVRLITPVS